MKNFKIDSICNLKSKIFINLAIKFLNLSPDCPVSVAHEYFPKQGKNISFVVHKKTSELVYVLSGRARAFLGDKSFNVTAGDYMVIPPGVKHRFVTSRGSMTALSVFSPPMTFKNLDAQVCNDGKKGKREAVK